MSQQSIQKVCNHESCVMSSLKGLRNGIYYGAKVRIVHALVMTILFKEGTIKDQMKSILQLTYEHSKNLGTFVFLYKTAVCLLNRLRNKNSKFHSLISGAIFGYYVFGDKTSVNTQINLYLLSRIIQGGCQNLQKKGKITQMKFFHILSAIVWGIVMFLFEDDKQSLQGSLSSSMDFLYKQSDKSYTNWRELVPVAIPGFIELLLED